MFGLDELAIWLIPISVGILLIQSFAWYLVGAYIVYFITVRALETISVGKLEEKPVLITGCDIGIRMGIDVEMLGSGHARLLRLARRSCGMRPAKSRRAPTLLTTFTLDVRNDESVNKARELVESKLQGYKGLWGIVNNAGIGDARGWADWQTPAMYDRFWQVNALGPIRVVHAFRHLVKKTKGRIVHVTSICGKFPTPTLGPYSTSKMAVGGYSDVLRAEMALWGVKVCILEPGFFKTPQANPQVSIDDATRVWERTPQSTKDEYGNAWFEWSTKLISGYLEYKCKPGAEFVVDAYFNALTSVFPRCRYQIGYDSIFQFTPLSYLPTRWQDWLMRGYFTFVDKPPATKVQY
ncbi:CRE-DHS-2 protein [Aphelenchoides fujianensis]|nr:CRE-DHS-2 protein [Aphelenchoides fujianensis]